MNVALAATRPLAGVAARRDRIVIPACVYGVAAYMVTTALSFDGLYPTAADRAKFAASVVGNSTFDALYGPARALDTLGGLVAWRTGTITATAVGLIAFLLVIRHTRAEEERGLTELVLAGAAGRYAPLLAAFLVSAATALGIGIVVVLALLVIGLPTAGSVALGAWFATAGIFFAGIGAVTAQLSENSRACRGLAGCVLGAAYALRALGDSGGGTLTWFSPIGWGEQVQAFDGERWWPLFIPLAATVAAVGLAAWLLARRDHGAGLIAQRPGRSVAPRWLASPLGFAWRVQRGALLGWSAGLFLTGVVCGALGNSVLDLLDTSKQISELMTQGGGGDPIDAFFASIIITIALMGTGFTIQSALRPRGEETAGRAEPLLATGIGRLRWMGAHLTVAVLGSVVVLAVSGFGMGLTYAIASGNANEVLNLTGATLAQAPAVWVAAGVAAVLVGLAPRLTGLAWIVPGGSMLLWIVGPLTSLPEWVLDISPYNNVPAVPAVPFEAGALLLLTAIAAGLAAIGLWGLARRDIA